MRIATSYIQQQSVDMMLRKQTELAQTQLQAGSAQRILKPSDDPVASVRILGLERDINLAEQYKSNANVADNKLNITDGMLSSAKDIVQRIRDLAIQGLNDVNSEGRGAIADEIRQLNEALLGVANSTDANGEFLFSGYQSNVQAFDETTYAYNGDNGQRNVRVGSGYLVEINEPGDQVFISTNLNGSMQSVFQTIDEFATALDTGSVGTTPNNGEFLSNIDNTLDQIFMARTRIGTRQNAVTHQRAINDAGIASMQTHLSQLKDLDYAQAITQLTAQYTGMQAAQQAYVKVQGLSLFNYI